MMKSKIFTLLLIAFISVISVSGQNNTKKANPLGTWKFEAPETPEGYKSGTMVVGMTEQKYTVTMTPTGSDYKLTAEKVKFQNDSLVFSLYVENEEVKVYLKVEDQVRMSGKASYSQGLVSLSVVKDIVPEKK
jgi:hypothetical protein